MSDKHFNSKNVAVAIAHLIAAAERGIPTRQAKDAILR
jgi:hypothetical protein